MVDEIISGTIICPQCGGENKMPTDEKFTECEFCGSVIYIDKRKVVNHYVVNSNFTKEQAEGNLRRWMASNFHVKDLDKFAQITQVSFYYFPLWYFKTKDVSGDKIYLQPARATPISEIKSIQIPAGNLKTFNKNDFNIKDFVTPDVLYGSAKSWLSQSGVNEDSIAESFLVHVPFYQFYYTYKGQQYSAMIEASSGKVYVETDPAIFKRLRIYNALGFLILDCSINNDIQDIDLQSASRGIYFYSLYIDNNLIDTKKMLLIK